MGCGMAATDIERGLSTAEVEERIAAGQSAADAEAEFLTDENFEKWYDETLASLKTFEG